MTAGHPLPSKAFRAEESLRDSEEQFRVLFDHNPVPTWVFDIATMQILAANDAAVRYYGYSREEFQEMSAADIASNHRKKDGTVINAKLTWQTFEVRNRRRMIVYAQDPTAKRHSEGKLPDAQKMEAVGRLAGRVAHDLNNILGVILIYAEVIADDLLPGEPLRADIEEIRTAALRATDLTRRLLAFTRPEMLGAKALDLNQSVEGMETMIQRVVGTEIELTTVPPAGLWNIEADPAETEQVVMNLASNTRDVMPMGGKLTVKTRNVDRDDLLSLQRLAPGGERGCDEKTKVNGGLRARR